VSKCSQVADFEGKIRSPSLRNKGEGDMAKRRPYIATQRRSKRAPDAPRGGFPRKDEAEEKGSPEKSKSEKRKNAAGPWTANLRKPFIVQKKRRFRDGMTARRRESRTKRGTQGKITT